MRWWPKHNETDNEGIYIEVSTWVLVLSSHHNWCKKSLGIGTAGYFNWPYLFSNLNCIHFHENFHKQFTSSRKNGAHFKFPCAILENRAPWRRTDQISVCRIWKVCAMAHMAHARIIPVIKRKWTIIADGYLLVMFDSLVHSNFFHDDWNFSGVSWFRDFVHLLQSQPA